MLIAGAAAAMPPVPYFSQCDPRWSGDRLGGDGPTICSQGCALTSAAMVMAYYGIDTDPERLNDAIGRGGYDATYCIYWSAVRNACHDEINQIEYDPGRITPFDETVLSTHLDLGRPVIVYVYCPGYGGYWGDHFVVVTGRSGGTYYINDPGFKTISTLDAYPTRHSMHIFSGNPPDINKPLIGDWDNDGIDTTGIYNYTTANFSLDSGLNISFGISGDIPITGDWNGNGYDTIGVFRPSTAQFFLDHDNDGISDTNATLGVIGDIPIAGDWDGDGYDNIGVFRQNHSDSGFTMFFLDSDNNGYADLIVPFGEPDDLPVVGDWGGDGVDNIGVYRSAGATGVFYLDIDNDGGTADIVTPEYGDLGDIPIAGDWDGDGDDNIGVYRPGTGEFFMDATVPDVLSSKTIYVDDDFSDDPSEHRWDTIQEGVDDAADGDTVIVYAGEYVENVRVDKSITLRGEGADVVTVRAASVYDHVFEVTVDWVNISGFTVTGATCYYPYYVAGIYIHDAEHCNISDNNASNNWYGIYLNSSSNNTLLSNIVSNNNYGIRLEDSNDNTLRNNIASDNRNGICIDYSINNTLQNNTANSNTGTGTYLDRSSDNMLQSNTMFGNTYNFDVSGDSLFDYIQNIDTSNTVDGKPIYYWVDQKDKQIPEGVGFVGVVNSTNITVSNLTLTKNYQGVLFAYTENSMVENVTVSNNRDGIYMWSSINNTLQSNTANPNNEYGIRIESSSNNTIADNNASDNNYGICLDYYSSNNTLTSNTVNSNIWYGIYLSWSSNNMLTSNTMSENRCNFGVRGYSLSCYTQNIDTSNTVDGKPIYYWVDQEDKQIPHDAGFVGVVNSTNITVRDLILTNNLQGILFAYTENSRIENVTANSNYDYGIYLSYSNDNTLQSNIASDNNYGICLEYYGDNNTLTSNTVNSNNYCGIYLCLWSDNNTLQSNIASNNKRYGIRLWSSTNNIIYHNNLINNTNYNAYDDSTNQWDSGSAGNYYPDYTGTDPDGDGIGNDPHPIPGGESIDRFPLMQPWAGDTPQKGDLNHDNQITPADAAIALRLAAGSLQCDPATLAAADVSDDGRVTSLDALMILQAATGKIIL